MLCQVRQVRLGWLNHTTLPPDARPARSSPALLAHTPNKQSLPFRERTLDPQCSSYRVKRCHPSCPTALITHPPNGPSPQLLDRVDHTPTKRTLSLLSFHKCQPSQLSASHTLGRECAIHAGRQRCSHVHHTDPPVLFEKQVSVTRAVRTYGISSHVICLTSDWKLFLVKVF